MFFFFFFFGGGGGGLYNPYITPKVNLWFRMDTGQGREDDDDDDDEASGRHVVYRISLVL